MKPEHEVTKAVKKLAGLAKLSVEQLTELHDATGKELAKRAKETAKKKKPSEMSDKDFEAYKTKLYSGDDSDDE